MALSMEINIDFKYLQQKKYIVILFQNKMVQKKKNIFFVKILGLLVLLMLIENGMGKKSGKTVVDGSYNYDTYKKQFNKDKESKEKENKKKEAFEKNLEIMEKLKEQNATYQIGIGKFSDYTDEDMKLLCNYDPSKSPIKPKQIPPILKAATVQPPPVDYRTLGKVTIPKRQGQCGSCWAFASIGYLESQFLIHTQQEYDLSEQYTASCTEECYKCDGGYPYYTLQKLKAQGAPLESTVPYLLATQPFTNAKFYSNCGSTSLSKLKLPNNVVSVQYFTNVTDTFLKEALRAHGPIVVAVTAGISSFFNYESGIYDGCRTYTGSIDHAVLLVGYTPEGHWIIKNSWGQDWGEGGYMTIHKDYNCKINLDVSYLDVEPSPTTNYGEVTQETTDGTVNDTSSDTSEDNSGNTDNTADNTGNSSADTQDGSSDNTGDTTDNTGDNTGDNTNDNPADNSIAETPGLSTFSALLSDSFGDGWNGNTLSVHSGLQIITVLGTQFTSGSSYGPINFTFNNTLPLQISVGSYGSWTNQMGIVITNITNNNNTVVYSRSPGLPFASNYIFYSYNPISNKIQYFIRCFDSWGDGWSGNTFAIKEGNTYKIFGTGFTNGHQYGPYMVQIQQGQTVSVIPYASGTFRDQISFTIRDAIGNLIFEHQESYYQMNTILGTFCADCTSLMAFKTVAGWRTGQVNPETGEPEVEEEKEEHGGISVRQKSEETKKNEEYLMVAVIVLSVILTIMTFVSIFAILFIIKLYKNSREVDVEESAYQIHKSTLTNSDFPDKSRNDIGMEKSLKSDN